MKFVDFMADSRDFYTGLIDPVCKKYGLTQMEFNILLFLANNPECDTAARTIKKRAFTKSHVSMSVRSLEERGLLTGEYYGNGKLKEEFSDRLCPKKFFTVVHAVFLLSCNLKCLN